MPALDLIFKERFQKLKERLSKVPARSFDLSIFSRLNSDVVATLNHVSQDLQPTLATKTRADTLFRELSEVYDGKQSCGTAACVVGWLPVLFPEEFIYANWSLPSLKSNPAQEIGIEDLAEWLGLPPAWGEDLFADDGTPYEDLERPPTVHDVLYATEQAIELYESCDDEGDVQHFLPGTVSCSNED